MVSNLTPEERTARMEKERADYLEENIEADDYFAEEEAAARAASLKKQKQVLFGSIVGLMALVAFIMYACQPPKGTIMYGLCGALLEQVVDYPTSMQHLYVEQFPRSLRIYFQQTDAFGQVKQDMIECIADPDARAFRFEQVLYNRKPLAQDVVERFNKTIPVVAASNPDLTLPPPPENTLKDIPEPE